MYGAGWGIELGFAISTIITTALVHVLVISTIFVGSLTASLLMGATFGFVRGATILTTARVDSPERLRNFHRNLDGMATRSRSSAVLALLVATLFGIGGVL